jgi:membrane protease YdiL (CAAX protease family)
MMVTHLNTKRIFIFLAFAFGIPWTAALTLYLTVGKDDLVKAATVANYIAVSTPALANVATRLITREGWGHLWLRPNFRRGWPFYLAVWLLPLLAVIVGGAIFYLLFPQSFDPKFGELRKLGASFPLAAAANPWMALLSLTLVRMVVGLTMNGVLSIGEEFGWRAYLLQRLMDHFRGANDAGIRAGGIDVPAARKAALLVGVIWGVWHWPLFFIGMKYDPGVPILFPLVYLVSTCSLSVLLSWATLRSGSVWPAAVGHGTINATASLMGYMLKGPAIPLVGPQPGGLIGVLGYLALALVLLFNRRAFAGEQEAGSGRVRAVVEA